MPDERTFSGLGVSAGVASGPVVVVIAAAPPAPPVEDGVTAFREAAATAEADLNDLATRLREAGREEAAEVVGAQALMAADPMLLDGVLSRLEEGAALENAIAATADELISMLRNLDDPYLAQRADDVGEVVDRFRRVLNGVSAPDLTALSEPSVLVADALTAAETAQLDPEVVVGFVTETGGPTSHVVIIARALGVPAVVRAEGIVAAARDGAPLVFDGSDGTVVLDPEPATIEAFAERADRHAARVTASEKWRGEAVEFDGRSMAVAANVASKADVAKAAEHASDGVGLLRTEFLFLDRSSPPSEDEQYEFYVDAVAAFDHPVVIRSFDIGGDKPADYLEVEPEENPFLGVRGARLYEHHPLVFETQVRAVLRAAATGPVQLMIPMVSTVDEIIVLREWIDRVADELTAEGIEHAVPPIGVMVEVPAIALVADAVMKHVDFVSIGSNDLTQYTLAADRTNGGLGHLQDPLHPSVLALCMFTAAAARSAGVPSSVCGLAAADPLGAAAFAAMGIDKLSVSSPSVNLIKAAIGDLDPASGRAALEAALAASSAEESRAALAAWVGG